MASRKDEVTRILEQLAGANEPEDSNPFVMALQEFAKALSANKAVDAAVEQMAHPQVVSLVTYPKYRRDHRSYMMTFYLEPSGARMLTEFGQEAARYPTPEDLWKGLLAFLTNSAFPTTLRQYAEIVSEPVEGFLRPGEPEVPSRQDAAVLIGASSQEVLGKAQPGEVVSVCGEARPFPFTVGYSAGREYAWLVSSGYYMEVTQIEGTDNALRITGRAAGLLEVRGD
jgi:hypothetical protein